jgi:hypothetical protein
VTPLPKRTRTVQGIDEKTVDLDFIQPGKTTRGEVRDKLKLIDTDLRSERFFLGRWSSSSSGGWVFLVGYGGGVGNASRVWKNGNLLVEFTSDGIVARSETFNDSHLTARLLAVAAELSPANPETVELRVTYWKTDIDTAPAKITISGGNLNFEELGTDKKPKKFTLPARDVDLMHPSITTQGSWSSSDPDPVKTRQTLHFAFNLKSVGGPRKTKIDVELTLPELVTLMSRISGASGGGKSSSARIYKRLIGEGGRSGVKIESCQAKSATAPTSTCKTARESSGN